MSSRGARFWTSRAVPLIAPEILGDIIAGAADLSIVVSPEGRVLSVLTHERHPLAGQLEAWESTDLRDHLASDSIPKLDAALAALKAGDAPRDAEMNHAGQPPWPWPVRYGFHRIGPDGTVLMLGRDLRPIAEMQEQLARAQIALERDYDDRRALGVRLGALMEALPEAVLFVSLETGRVLGANAAAASLLGRRPGKLEGADFPPIFAGREEGLLRRLEAAAETDPPGRVEADLRSDGTPIWLTATAFRAAGERQLLVRAAASGMAAAPSPSVSRLEAFFEAAAEGVAFLDETGVVLAANDALLGMLDLPRPASLRGRAFADHLARGAVEMAAMLDQARRERRLRLSATRLLPRYGAEVPAEVSVVALTGAPPAAFALVARPAASGERRPGAAVSDDAVRSVIELVGASPLREIVSETTDVVEKMCIETALDLTQNNRVAAAEMLGLSRQSLYVKLRKYGLLVKDAEE